MEILIDVSQSSTNSILISTIEIITFFISLPESKLQEYIAESLDQELLDEFIWICDDNETDEKRERCINLRDQIGDFLGKEGEKKKGEE
jgi:hypothetical protein